MTTRHGPAPLLNLGCKEGTHTVMNVGTNVDPIIPQQTCDPCAVSIAFEPIVSHLTPNHLALHVIPAAVRGDNNGWSAMHIYNFNRASSSLSKASHKGKWNKHTELKIVPTIGFRKILESLRGYNVDFILTDVQGHDFEAVSSVGDLLAEVGVKRIVTEVYKDKVHTCKGVQNDLGKNWLPHMTKTGCVFEGLSQISTDLETLVEGCQNAQEIKETCKVSTVKMEELTKAGLNEHNALWRLKSEAASDNLGIHQCGTTTDDGLKFAPKDHAKCL